MGRGIVAVSYGLLDNVLHLPADHRIVGGPSLPETSQNEVTPRVQFKVSATEDRDNLVPSRTYVGEFS